ncbi:hypothetical protein [Ramlibacter sp. WS9]|uniref:hypothetical protein n=1 Tax=Ramlibacter sp. WS9 TaxID=1882741 RepID=UPI00114146C3|nr:hypothetical protein [Ramlibacter sp. WS9]ROZ61491.1 hypothetical protein EEB15_32590 [Ramlibacter sp. WS9]
MTTEVGIQSLFPSLEAKAARLHTASDSANELLSSIESRLIQLNLGVEVWFSRPIDSTDQEGDIGPNETSSHVVQILGFAKAEGKWSLAVKPMRAVSGFFQGDMDCPFVNHYADGPVTPLLKASRALRISAMTVMPEFLVEIEKRVDELVDSLDGAASKIQPAQHPSDADGTLVDDGDRTRARRSRAQASLNRAL